jgi:hypothetical protein
MPRHEKSDDEDAEKSGDDFVKEKEEESKKQHKKPPTKEEKRKEDERIRFLDNLMDVFMDYWRNKETRHPGILYHLTLSEAFSGFVLYHKNMHQFEVWEQRNIRVKFVAPLPINLPYSGRPIFQTRISSSTIKVAGKPVARKVGQDRFDVFLASR